MPKKILPTGIAGLALALALTGPASAASVTVRVEGSTSTLVRQVVTTVPGTTIDKSGSGGATCDSNTAGGALETATGGDWSGPAFGTDQSVNTIKKEAHVFGTGSYWSFDVNNAPAPVGLCDTSYVPADGDEILFYAACDGQVAATCFSEDPLDVRAPRTAAPGTAVTVSVDQYTSPFGATPTKAPASGATVTGGGVTATTGADGTASLTFTQRGPVTVTATKGARVRDEADLCVTDGADGFCGTTRPGDPAPPTPAPAPVTTTSAAIAPDRSAPQARIAGISEGQVFRHGRGPRELTAAVGADPSGLLAVKLGLSRSYKGRCSVLSGKKAAFRHARCGSHPVFAVGDRADVSYLLPKRLAPGRYVLDVVAIDRAFNRDALARGRNRVVFTVR